MYVKCHLPPLQPGIGLELTDQAKEAAHRPQGLCLSLSSTTLGQFFMSIKITLYQASYPPRPPDTICIDFYIGVVL